MQTCSSYSYLQNRELTTVQHMSKGDGGKKMHKLYSICHIVSHFQAWQAHPWLWVSQKKWFQFLNLEKKPKIILEKHGEVGIWPNIAHIVVLEATKFVFTTTQYISLSYDEVSIINNHKWLSIHVYVMKN